MKTLQQPNQQMGLQPMTLLTWMALISEGYNKQNCLGTAGNYSRTLSNLQSYLKSRNKKDIPLHQVDGAEVACYTEWLKTSDKSQNSVAFHLRNLRSAYNKAVKVKLLPIPEENPFEHVHTNSISTHPRTSESNVILQLEELSIPQALIAMGKKSKRKSFAKMVENMTFARDAFLFCFYASGLPFVDFAHLTHKNIQDGKLCYDRQKTGAHIEMKILPQMQIIIDRYANNGYYLFPVLTETSVKEAYKQYNKALRKYNHRLRQISLMLHLKTPLSSYAPRHIWACMVYHGGMPESCIKERLGHGSLDTTRFYLKSFDSSKIDEINIRIIKNIHKKFAGYYE